MRPWTSILATALRSLACVSRTFVARLVRGQPLFRALQGTLGTLDVDLLGALGGIGQDAHPVA